MKREIRSLRCDSDPHAVTRRDLVPAPIRFAEESSPASSTEPIRELQPYPALRPHADDQTVKYGIVQAVSESSRGDGERPSDLPVEFRSGTRVTPTATLPPVSGAHSTTPPASQIQTKALPASANARIRTPLPASARISTPLPASARIRTPLPANARISTPLPNDGRYATPSISFAPPPRPVPESSLPPPRAIARSQGPSLLVMLLVAGVTIVVAAFVGASLGDGSLQRWWAHGVGDGQKPAPAATGTPARAVSAPPAPAASARPQDATPAEPEPPPAPGSRAPTLRFQDLPAEQTSDADPTETPATPLPKRARGPHRH